MSEWLLIDRNNSTSFFPHSQKVMQVTAKTIPDKQTGFDRQVQGKNKPTAASSGIQALKTDENLESSKGAERNETSQYLKVLSRIENLLVQEKLPDAAVDGFVGAIKKQIDLMSETDRQMLLKLPEAIKLELKNLNDLPEMIKNNLRDEGKSPVLLELLRLPKFAVLMRTDSKPAPKTYTAQSAQTLPTVKSSPINILDIPTAREKPVLAGSPEANNNTVDKKSAGLTKLTA